MEELVQRCVSLIKRGYRKERITEEIPAEYDAEEIYEIAKCRIKIKEKFSKKNLYFDEIALRYSTPEIIGRYRADKIRNLRIFDVSCGCGMQAIFFAMTNEFVLGADIEERRIRYARKNAMAYGVDNVEFIVLDALSDEALRISKDFDIIYSDPARAESERERRLDNLMPPPLRIIERYGDRYYIFDLPPQIRRDRIPTNWNLEYISLNGKINRLTAYINESSDGLRTATTLPAKVSISGYGDEDYSVDSSIGDFLYEVDESVYYSSLLGELQKRVGDFWYISIGRRRTLASSYKEIDNPFLRKFIVVGIAETMDGAVKILRKNFFGKVTLRISIEPKDYWSVRKEIERKLSGKRKGYLFYGADKYIVCEEVS